jgi:hypothetical protein
MIEPYIEKRRFNVLNTFWALTIARPDMLSPAVLGRGSPGALTPGFLIHTKMATQQIRQSEWMKNYPRRASLVTAQACTKEVNAASAEARAIACSSMEIRRPFDNKGRSAGKARVRSSAHGNWFAQNLG